ncbi:MAG: acyl-CoA dehydrogenase [Symbiobacteriia bacterium]
MNFFLSEEQEAIRSAIREFVLKEVEPGAAEREKNHEFPWGVFKALARDGYLCMQVPEQYGGGGADYISFAIVLEELARGDAVSSVMFEVHNTLHAEAILHFGSEEQKKYHLPRLARGEVLGAYCLTEPSAGSDAGALRTRADRDGDDYILNGQKTFITNGGVADQYIVMATVDPTKGAKGITAFIVTKDMPGVSFGKPEEKMGLHASSTTDVFLDNVRVPAANRLGDEGQGFKIALATLDGGRIGIAAQALGLTQKALDIALPYAKERQQFGKPIGEFQAIQWKLADMATELDAARLMTYRAAFLRQQGVKATKEISMAKLFASDVAMKHTVEAVQILGGYGYLREYGVERLMRDAKITQLYEGTNEIQRLVISRELLRG